MLLRVVLILLTVVSLNACQEQTMDLGSNQEGGQQLDLNSPLAKLLASSDKPAVIKFHADWCSTCKQYAPSYQKVKESHLTKVDFFEVNVDEPQYKELLKQLKISRIPETVFVSQDRSNVIKKLGDIPKTKLESMINSHLL